MTFPTNPVDVTDVDADTDSPLNARQDLLDLAQKVNQMIQHVSTYAATLLDDVDAAAVRATLGLGDAATKNVTDFWVTGNGRLTLATSASAGWVMANDGTIGNAASGGTTRANADTVALFTLLWNNTLDAQCAVSGGRGANAAADYGANKTIALPKALGRALCVAGAGAGLTARVLALAIGHEALQLHSHTGTTGDQDRDHTHDVVSYQVLGGGGSPQASASVTNSVANPTGGASQGHLHPFTTNNTGAGDSGNIQPSSFWNVEIRL